MPRPLSVSQETIIVLYYSIQSKVSAVWKPESPLESPLYNNIGKSIHA